MRPRRGRARSIRADALELHNFGPAPFPGHDADTAAGDSRFFSQEFDQGTVGRSVHRGSSEADDKRPLFPAFQGIFRAPRLDLNGDPGRCGHCDPWLSGCLEPDTQSGKGMNGVLGGVDEKLVDSLGQVG